LKLIEPSEVSARILTLLDESDERVIIVSPYMKISKWYKLVNKIGRLKERKIHIEIYVRDDPGNEESFRDLDRLDLVYKKIPHLHCKIYMNERRGIVASMNLLLSSDINALEIGYATETETEYAKLLSFYYRYIHTGGLVQCDTIAGRPAADLELVMDSIREKLTGPGKDSWVWLEVSTLQITIGYNNYSVLINEGHLRITARLRKNPVPKKKSVPNSRVIVKKIGDRSIMRIDILPDPEPGFLHLSGHAPCNLKSTGIYAILETEAEIIIDSVIRFVNAMEGLVL
jgi:hypothetical protein